MVNAYPKSVVLEPVQPGQSERQFEKPPEPRAKPGEIQIPLPGQKAPANADQVRFVLNRLTVDGSTVYSAASAGMGIRLNAGRHVAAYVEFAKPLTKIVTQENDRKARTYVGVSMRF